jgi:hypothetical protein
MQIEDRGGPTASLLNERHCGGLSPGLPETNVEPDGAGVPDGEAVVTEVVVNNAAAVDSQQGPQPASALPPSLVAASSKPDVNTLLSSHLTHLGNIQAYRYVICEYSPGSVICGYSLDSVICGYSRDSVSCG